VRRRGRPVDGWLNLDKPAGLSSAAAVGRVRRLFEAAKAGHAGTLDPLATGVLPLALGEATKTVSFLMDAAKAYRFTIRWGEARDTEDAEGAVTARSDRRPGPAEVEAALPAFIGTIQQVPPAYSALKIAGRPAYDRARAGEEVALAPRIVRVDRLILETVPDADHAVLSVWCGKGLYVRSLARDLALRLGTVGHIAALRRLAVGPFRAEDSIPLEKLEALGHSPAAFSHLQPVETALDDIPALAFDQADCTRLRQGQAVRVPRVAERADLLESDSGTVVRAIAEGVSGPTRLVALARLDGDGISPLRVFNWSDSASRPGASERT